MKLRFAADLPHQRAAIDAVLEAVDVAAPASNAPPRVHANPSWLPGPLAVEMETGTGKTYVFLRTALELAQRHHVRKFLIVVPSVAIREGVLATLRATADHFAGLFPGVPYRFFGYRRERLSRLRQFVRSTVVEFVVLTIDAFTKDSNVLRRPCDAFGGASPLALLAAIRPVVIVDEPHHLQTTLRQDALASLTPAMVLRYGATLGAEPGRIVHRLTPAAAHRAQLVKTIVVRGVEGAADADVRYAQQIRATVEAHLRRQEELAAADIKVLSLFFLDRVDSFTAEDGRARLLFDEAYESLRSGFPAFADRPAAQVRSGYFAAKSGRAVDSRTGRTKRDVEAYDLILRDKARLLSFEEPVCFVFSHSALREGWDNPNVFQICALGESASATRKRQEMGRGIRLCVDRNGERVRDPAVNVLEVFASESYEVFVAGLQSEDATWEPSERPPVPARQHVRPAAPESESAQPYAPANIATLVAAASGTLGAFEADPGFCEPGPPARLVDEALARLQRARPPAPLRRATLLDIVEASGVARGLLADPSRGGRALAEAVLAALRPESTPNGPRIGTRSGPGGTAHRFDGP